MGTTETLVSLEHADGTAGVYRDEDGIWLTGDLGGTVRCGTRLSDHRSAVVGLLDQRTAEGGRLPPGAVAAEVTDDLGVRHRAAASNGAWVVVLDQPTEGNPSPVRFLDERGETVAPRLPAEWPRSSVDDTTENCPACGACAWDEVQPLEAVHGMHADGPDEPGPLPPRREEALAHADWEPTPFVVCRVCGHEETIGVVYIGDDEEHADVDEIEVQRRLREHEREHRAEQRQTLAQAGFPIYAPDGLEVSMNGWGGPPSGVNRVTLTHTDESGRQLSIETRSGEAVYGSARELALEELEDHLHGMGGDWEWPTGSRGAITVGLEARDRKDRAHRRRLMNDARVAQGEMSIDGRAQTVTFAQTAGCWAAVLRRDDLVVIATSTGIAPEDVRLIALVDPAAELFQNETE